jgi:hypothetical protein
MGHEELFAETLLVSSIARIAAQKEGAKASIGTIRREVRKKRSAGEKSNV